MSSTRKNVAYHKVRPISQPPLRPGAPQCIRTCSNCIPISTQGLSNDEEGIVALKSFDNLLVRRSILLSQYSSVQYHPGQIDILKNYFHRVKSPANKVYIIAVNRFSDTNYVDMVLGYVGITTPYFVDESTHPADILNLLEAHDSIALVMQLRTCYKERTSIRLLQKLFSECDTRQCVRVMTLKDHIATMIHAAQRDFKFDINFIPITVTKDHEKTLALAQGSVCVQVLEPYSLQEYLNGLSNAQKTIHLMQHIYYDAAKHAVILPSHIVASLILYLESDGVTATELTSFMDWIRSTSIETGLQIGFSGDSSRATSNAISMLGNHVQLCRLDRRYRARDHIALMDYSDILLTSFAFYNLIALSVIVVYNKTTNTERIVSFKSGVKIRVEKEIVIKVCRQLALEAERNFPCRRPCTTLERSVEATLDSMVQFGNYFKIQAPALSKNRPRYWAGESDEDDDRYLRENRDNPALKVWLLVSNSDLCRQRLNYFLNAAKGMIASDILSSLVSEHLKPP